LYLRVQLLRNCIKLAESEADRDESQVPSTHNFITHYQRRLDSMTFERQGADLREAIIAG
jgi:hypothetical protein